MNIHEYQAKDLLKEFGAPVPKGVIIYDSKQNLKFIFDKKKKDLKK